MHRGEYFFILATCAFLGLVCGEAKRSAPTIITRRSDSVSSADEDLEILLERLRSLRSDEEKDEEKSSVRTRSNIHQPQKKSGGTGASARSTNSTNLNSYLNLFSSFYSIYQPLLLESFLQTLPQAVVCALAERTQCGWQADFTSTLTSSLSGPLLSFLSSVKSQTCSSASSFVRMSGSSGAPLGALQEMLTELLSSSLPFSDTFMTAWNSFIELTLPSVISFISDYMLNHLQTLTEFLTVGLQFGVELPHLDQSQPCQQGDLKQLIMWGMTHNISWSFGDSIMNIFFTPGTYPCSYTDIECQNAQTIQQGRSSMFPFGNPIAPLTCDQQDVSQLNDTLCAEILANRSLAPDVLYGVCKALSTLSHSEVIQVWRNTCHMIQLALTPLLEPCPALSSESSLRVARSSLSLSQLLCNYENWTTTEVDPGLVTMCSDNDPEAFLLGVCNNFSVMQALTANPNNAWMWEYCANASDRYAVLLYCAYDTWNPQTLDPSVVALCWNNDQVRMETLLCQDLDFFMTVFSSLENGWLTPNCTQVPTSQPVDINTFVSQSCKYSEWRNVGTISIDQISLCIQNDEVRFVSQVCTNSTFLAALVLDKTNTWVRDYCIASLRNPPTFPPVVSTTNIPPTTLTDSSSFSSFSSTSFSSTVLSATLPSITSYTTSPTKTSTVSPFASSISLSSSALSPSLNPSIPPLFSSVTLSPTTPLSVTSKASSLSLFSTGAQTALPVASSVTLSPSSPPKSSSSASKFTVSSLFSNSSMTVSAKVSTVVSQASVSIRPSSTTSLTGLPTASRTAFLTISPSPTLSSSTLSTTPPNTGSPTVPTIADWCNYALWAVLPVDPSVVGLCWQFDVVAFHLNVCCNTTLFDRLTLDPDNQWLKTVCSSNETVDLLPQVCLYSEWNQPTFVDMTVLALCADLDTANFTQKVCTNAAVLHNLMANLDNTWLLKQCSNLTGAGAQNISLLGFKPSEQCQYASWSIALPDAALLALCWDYDQTKFISSICLQPAMLSHIIQEPSSLWVSTLCVTYSNHTNTTTTSNNTNSANTNTTNSVQPCLVKELIEGLKWTCSVDLSVVCQPEVTQFQRFQFFLRCGAEVLLPRMQQTMTTEVASMINQATSVMVVLLLALEENEMTTLSVTSNIQQNVLDSVAAFLERETDFSNKQMLLQCFGKVLTSLMQTGRDVTGNNAFFIQEYFRIPLASLRVVLSSVDVTTMRLILQFLSRNQASLQLTDEYVRTMMSVLIQIHLRLDTTLFPDLAPLLDLASPEDIMLLPPVQNNDNVLNTINSIINSLSLEQRQAFGWWYSQSITAANMTVGGLSFIRNSGNLIAYLPFSNFQHFSPAQLLDGLDLLLRNDLGSLKQQFVAQTIIRAFRNLTADQFRRLGTLTCLVSLSDLQVYVGSDVFPVIQNNINMCITQGVSIPSSMISSLLLNSTDLQSPSTLSPQRISQLANLLPLLGPDFLQQLSQSQLLASLDVLSSVPLTPVQAAVIIDKVSSSLNLSVPGTGSLSKLGSLVSGIRTEALLALPPATLLSALANYTQYAPRVTTPQASAITTKLWGAPVVITRLDEVAPLLPNTPLLCVIPQAHLLLTNASAPYTRTWNTQQAKTLFNEATSTIQSLSTQQFSSLGTVAQGARCKVLMDISGTKLLPKNPSVSSMRDILRVLRQQPVPLHPSLKKCVIETLYEFDFSELLGDMGSQIALSFPVSAIKKFSISMMDSLRQMIVEDPRYFLVMPKTKQAILVDKILQRLGMHTGKYTEEEFRSMGVMATFVVDEVFVQLDRGFFVDNMEFLRGFCFDSSKRDMVASMLQEPITFGPVQNWTATTLNQVDRFLFFLPDNIIQLIPQDLMSQERIERLFGSQQQWESGDVGSLCDQVPSPLFAKQQFVLQYFLGFLKPGRVASLTPSCESLHLTQPAAWPVGSLTDMPSVAFRRCLELIGQDPFFSPYQILLLLRKTKDVYGTVSSFTPSVISQLGFIATQLSVDEIAALKLSDMRSLSSLGAINNWTKKQLGVLFSAMLNSTKQTPSQLDTSSFVALGYIICGIEVPLISSLNAIQFGKAVLWLGRLNLSCSEDQLQAMITLLSNKLVFGLISSWGPEVFIEIGAFAAGLPDMAMSALVKEQIEGITPLAISLIPAKKFAVVFNQAQISVFSYEQAAAVTTAQRLALSPVQETALSMVLNPLEDKPVDFRGRSLGVAARVCPLCHLCTLLVMLLMLFFSGPL